MKVSIIGHLGYIGQNIKKSLISKKSLNIFLIDRETSKEVFLDLLMTSDILIHCAAIQRHQLNVKESYMPNFHLTKYIVDNMNKSSKLIFLSTIHYNSNTPFGVIRKLEEDYIMNNVINYNIYHLPYTFGPYGKANYNNVFNTYIINVCNNREVFVGDFIKEFPLLSISDFADKLVNKFNNTVNIIDKFSTINITLPKFLFQLSEIHRGEVPNLNFAVELKKVYEWYKNN